MHWDKKKYRLPIMGGKGQMNTEPMRGMLEHLIVKPENGSIKAWSMRIIDKDGDDIYERLDHEGRLDDKDGLPIGKDQQEKVTIEVFDCAGNGAMQIILKVRDFT